MRDQAAGGFLRDPNLRREQPPTGPKGRRHRDERQRHGGPEEIDRQINRTVASSRLVARMRA